MLQTLDIDNVGRYQQESFAYLEDAKVEKILGFRSIALNTTENLDLFLVLEKNQHVPSWYPSSSLECPNAIHSFLLLLNGKLPAFSQIQKENQEIPDGDGLIALKDVHHNLLGFVKPINMDIEKERLSSLMGGSTSILIDKFITSSMLSLLLSAFSVGEISSIQFPFPSIEFEQIMKFSRLSGYVPASQVADTLVLFYAGSASPFCTMTFFPRASYYNSLARSRDKSPSGVVASIINKRTCIFPSSQLSWDFIEAQSLNSIHYLPFSLIEKEQIKFLIHAPSNLYQVQEFGRWLVGARGAQYLGSTSQLSQCDPTSIDVVFIHYSVISLLHQETWIPGLLRLGLRIRFYVFGSSPFTIHSTPITERIPREIFPLDGGGITTFSLRMVLSPSNEYRIHDYIKRLLNFPGWKLLLPSGFFDVFKATIDVISIHKPTERRRLHSLRDDLFKRAYHETSKEASDNFSEFEFILACAQEMLFQKRFFVLVDDPDQGMTIPRSIYEKYPGLCGNSDAKREVSPIVFVGAFDNLVKQFN